MLASTALRNPASCFAAAAVAAAVIQRSLSFFSSRHALARDRASVLMRVVVLGLCGSAAAARGGGGGRLVAAWRRFSLDAVTIRSVAPFWAFGASRKSGGVLTKPPSLTARTTLSRS